MANAAYLQPLFLGGEFSPFFQGRADDPRYRGGLNRCYNTIPVEEGAGVRRPGSAFASTTYHGLAAKKLAFDFEVSNPYNVEFTDGRIRFLSGAQLVTDDLPPMVLGISSATPAVVETNEATTWATGDQVEFMLPSGDTAFAGMSTLMNRQFDITAIDSTHFSLADPITGDDIDGSSISLGAHVLLVGRITTFTTPYAAGSWAGARIVQSDDEALILCRGFRPYKLSQDVDSNLHFAAAVFQDGPYLDPPKDGTALTPDGTTGTIGLTASSTASINDGNGFVSSDVGRMVRLFSEPLAWSDATSYSAGDPVKFQNAYYVAAATNSNSRPDTNVENWEVSTTAAAWTWGRITSVDAADGVHLALAPSSTDAAGQQRADGPLLYTNPIAIWRLGTWSDYSGWPENGTYYGGRFYLAGAIENRFDASMSNELARFDPTGQDGTVADNCGISETLTGKDRSPIYWMLPTAVGVVMGTKRNEWLLQASTLQDPITPTSIQVCRVTRFGAENIEPVETPLATIFVQRFGRKVIEYTPDASTGKFTGTNLSISAKHLIADGVAEVAYQQETTPVIWARTSLGALIGCTYKRESPFGSQPASFAGWHQHALGSGRTVESIQSGPSIGGALDAVSLVTSDSGVRYNEILTDIFEEDNDVNNAWFVDAGISPFLVEDTTGTSVKVYGYEPHAGKTLSVFLGGLDCGDYLVAADGTITVPYQSDADHLFTVSYLEALGAEDGDYGALNTGVQFVSTAPGVVNNPGDVQSYIYNSESTVNYYTAVDWSAGRFFAWDATNANIKSFTITGNTQVAEKAYSALTGSGISGFAAHFGHGYIAYADGTHNAVALHIMDYNFNIIQTLGVNSTGVLSQQSGILYPYTGVVAQGLGLTFLFSSGPLVPIAVTDISSVPARYLFDAYDTASTFKHAALCAGLQRLDVCTAFVCGNTGSGVPGAGPLAFGRIAIWDADLAFTYSENWIAATSYGIGSRVQYNGIQYESTANMNSNHQPDTHPGAWAPKPPQGASLTILNRFSPGEIDAAWTKFDGLSPQGMVYDSTDGNVLTIFVGTITDGGDLQTKLVKISSQDGSILWATALDAPIILSSYSRVSNSRLNLFTPVQNTPTKISHIYAIDTTDGSVTAMTTVNGILSLSASTSFGSGEHSDDVSGLLTFNADYVSTTPGAPAPDGNTPSTTSATWLRALAGHGAAVTVTNSGQIPGVAGFTYNSEGQILRSLLPADAGSNSGPALGMTRRTHMMAALLHQTQGISFGTSFSEMKPALFKSDGGLAFTKDQLFSGIYQAPLEDGYGFDSMLCWRISRPYPANVIAVETFKHTQER